MRIVQAAGGRLSIDPYRPRETKRNAEGVERSVSEKVGYEGLRTAQSRASLDFRETKRNAEGVERSVSEKMGYEGLRKRKASESRLLR
jgi:hypothetical protein